MSTPPSTVPGGVASAAASASGDAADTATAFWVTGPSEGELRTERLPVPAADEVRVRALYSGISRGTEALVFRGEVPPGERARMRAPFQAGEFPWPVKYGYIGVGEVEAGPSPLLGRRVFCLHPHQDRYVVPASAVHALPDDVPSGRAVLAANLETAINGLWDAAPGIGDRVSVVGAGAVGCLVAWLAARLPGCDVELVDTDPGRADLAAALGARFATPDEARDERDLVVHASGDPAGLERALELAGFEATVLEMSWFGERRATLSLGGAFHSRRLSIRASQVGTLPAARRARWDYRRRLALALELLADPVLDRLITDEAPFATLPAVMRRLADAPGDTICQRISYP